MTKRNDIIQTLSSEVLIREEENDRDENIGDDFVVDGDELTYALIK